MTEEVTVAYVDYRLIARLSWWQMQRLKFIPTFTRWFNLVKPQWSVRGQKILDKNFNHNRHVYVIVVCEDEKIGKVITKLISRNSPNFRFFEPRWYPNVFKVGAETGSNVKVKVISGDFQWLHLLGSERMSYVIQEPTKSERRKEEKRGGLNF